MVGNGGGHGATVALVRSVVRYLRIFFAVRKYSIFCSLMSWAAFVLSGCIDLAQHSGRTGSLRWVDPTFSMSPTSPTQVLPLNIPLSSALAQSRVERLGVVLLNLSDAPVIPFDLHTYQRLVFGVRSTQRMAAHGAAEVNSFQILEDTPITHTPLGTSAREWLLEESGGALLIEPGPSLELYSAQTVAFIQAEHEADRQHRAVSLEQALLEAMPSAQRSVFEANQHQKWIVFHNGPINFTFQSGRLVFVKATTDQHDDIVNTGVLLHELGHLLFAQPDRYGFQFGSLRLFDNMADNYEINPAGYSGHSRVQAGFSVWMRPNWPAVNSADVPRGNRYSMTLPPLHRIRQLPRFTSTLWHRYEQVTLNQNNISEDIYNYFSIENRTRFHQAMQPEALPKEGVLLLESTRALSPIRAYGQGQTLRLHEQFEAPNTFQLPSSRASHIERGLVDLKRPILNYFSDENFSTWSFPITGQQWSRFLNQFRLQVGTPSTAFQVGNGLSSLNCFNALSLNILSECVWQILNIVEHQDQSTSVSVLDSTETLRFERVSVDSQTPDLQINPPGNKWYRSNPFTLVSRFDNRPVVKRLYVTTSRPMSFYLRGALEPRKRFVLASAGLHVVDLVNGVSQSGFDPVPSEYQIEFHAPNDRGWSAVLVEKPFQLPLHPNTPTQASVLSLPSRRHWHQPLLHVTQGRQSIVLLDGFGATPNNAAGVLRATLVVQRPGPVVIKLCHRTSAGAPTTAETTACVSLFDAIVSGDGDGGSPTLGVPFVVESRFEGVTSAANTEWSYLLDVGSGPRPADAALLSLDLLLTHTGIQN